MPIDLTVDEVAQTGHSEAANRDRGAARRLKGADYAFWLLVAFSPLLFAIASWNPSGANKPLQAAALAYSLPITAIETALIVYAMLMGWKPASAFNAMPPWARLTLSVLVVVAVSTSAIAVNPVHSSIRTYQLLIHLLFGFSAWHLFRADWAGLRSHVWPLIVAGTCLYVLAVIAWVIAVQDDPRFDWVRFSFGVVHIRQTGFYSAVGASAAIGLAAIARTRTPYWLAVAAASLMLGMSYWSGTRGALLAVWVAFAAGFIFLPAMRNWRAAGALVGSAAIGALLSLSHSPPHPAFGLLRISETAAATGADELATGRLGMWKAAVSAILERPLFGYGESQFGAAVPGWSQFNHPHNIFVQILVQWGIIGFICYFSLVAFVAWRVLTIARRGGPDLVPPFLVAGALFTMSLYEGSLYHPYPIMMMVLSAAFVLATRPSDDRPARAGRMEGVQ